MEKEIWVLIEHREKEIEEASLEVLVEARRLAKKARLRVAALVLGSSAQPFAEALNRYGADRICAVPHELLKQYTTDGYTTALADLVKIRCPEIFLLAATALGRDLAPRLATRLQIGLISDCRVLDINKEGALEMTRPSTGGRVYTRFEGSGAKPCMATIRPGVLGLGKPLKGNKAEVEEISMDLKSEDVRTRVLGISSVDRRDLDISEAEFVLAFGRGLGEKSNLIKMEALADEMNACIAGSRVAVDEGYVSFERQIGQTGKTISPKVIFCCGISGAQQFTMGMRESGFIVAINNNRKADIFKVADISVLGDLNEVVPELVEVLKSSK
ncbi:MAG: electron transfer flavoprotein subunit alpha/FixB family protein [Deltaproteobacteria bacterium]|nr:electron transfer flavoprotein subunit alpha/FixB family protein [Deltaproteobacteria bacterium]